MKEFTYRVDRRTVAGDWPFFAFLLATIAVTAWAFPRLPDQAAVHFDAAGTADRFAGPWFLALWWPIFATGLYLLLLVLPLADPRRANYASFGRIYGYLRQATPAFLLVIHLAQLADALGMPISPLSVALVAMSALFLLLGLVMDRFRYNYFVGFRTPWTLASEEVWNRTPAFGSRVWVALSLLNALVVLLPLHLQLWASMGVIAVMVVVPVVYSHLVFRQVNA